MTSAATMLFLIVVYAAIAVQATIERNWWRCLYFIGAIIISVAVLGMTEKGGRS